MRRSSAPHAYHIDFGQRAPQRAHVPAISQGQSELVEPAVVYIVEDDVRLRDSIASLLTAAGMTVRLFGSVPEFLRGARSSAPACLVLDVNLPGGDGLELQGILARTEPGLPIVFITAHADIRMSVRAMKAGAVEFLPKPFADDDLLVAVNSALDRARQARRAEAKLRELRARFELLSARERQVLAGVVEGLANKHVAYVLGISEVTVKIHRGQVMRKMKAASLPDLVRMCVRLGVKALRSEREAGAEGSDLTRGQG
jgi:FixJ family two-component response regulator